MNTIESVNTELMLLANDYIDEVVDILYQDYLEDYYGNMELKYQDYLYYSKGYTPWELK